MRINNVEIQDTFAEAFPMVAARVLVTAANDQWVQNVAAVATGFATSVIACGCEGGIEGRAEKTPDGRPGLNLLFFTMDEKGMEKQLLNRIGQCIMTCPTASCFSSLNGGKTLEIGGKLRFFGNGFQLSKYIMDKRYWRIPVMEGEFLVQESFGVSKAIGGGNFLILGKDSKSVLAASEKAVQAIRKLRDVILPFPGGVVRSGSQVGSKYKFLMASTNVAYCPTLKKLVKTELAPEVNSVLEIVIDGLSEEAIRAAMKAGIEAACSVEGISKISAGNYGGKLGKYHFYLKDLELKG